MINIVLGIHGGIDGDVGGPFFYSRTCCCGASGTSLELPPHFDIWYPRTCNHYTMCKGGFNVTFVKACDVPWLNPDQPAWSTQLVGPRTRTALEPINEHRTRTTLLTSQALPV